MSEIDPYEGEKQRAIMKYRQENEAKAQAFTAAKPRRAEALNVGFYKVFGRIYSQNPQEDRVSAFGETVVYTDAGPYKIGFAYPCPVCGEEHVFPIKSLYEAGRYLETKEQVTASCPNRKPTAESKLLDALREFIKPG